MRKYVTTVCAICIIASLVLILYSNYMPFNSTVSVNNPRWQKVHIQVKKANSYNDGHNDIIFDQYLIKGQSRTFTTNSSDDILYRRDLDPDRADGIHFTNWQHANSTGSAVCTINNP